MDWNFFGDIIGFKLENILPAKKKKEEEEKEEKKKEEEEEDNLNNPVIHQSNV